MDFVNIDSGYQPKVKVDDQDRLFFGGTAYLGLNYHPAYLMLFAEGLQIWGLNNGASRHNNVRLSIYLEAEEFLAKEYHSEHAVTFSSGWLAAQSAVKELSKRREVIYVNDVHPALFVEQQPVLKLADAISTINHSPNSHFLLISNSVNNIIPQIFDFRALGQVLPSKEVVLLLDHSHGFGVLEQSWLANLKLLLPAISVVLCGSLAKGLSLDAGVVLGDKIFIEQIKESATFNGASPCSPAVGYTYLNGQQIIKASRQKLQDNLDYFFSHINAADFLYTVHFPVIQILNPIISGKLIKAGVLFTAFPYPDQDSPILNRLVITANHKISDLDQLLSIIY